MLATDNVQTVKDLLNFRPIPQPESYYFYGAGIFPADLTEAYTHAFNLGYAKRYPAVPAWLGEHPPQIAIFMPNGEIITYGELGLNFIPLPDETQYSAMHNLPQGLEWYRYSPAGELLGQCTSSENYIMASWRELYAPGFTEMANARREEISKTEGCQVNSSSNRGYHAIVETVADQFLLNPVSAGEDGPERRIFVVWDMYGNEIDPASTMVPESTYIGQRVSRDQLQKNYTLQVEAGLTDPTVASPFAGLPNGPVVVDSTPSERPLQAQKYGEGYVTVRPLDDPANPYSGQYDPWDYWLRDNVNAQDPKAQAHFQQAALEYQAKVSEYRAAGKEIPKDLKFDPSYTIDPNDPWQHYRIYVTRAGWIVPFHEQWVAENERRYGKRDLREPAARRSDDYFSLDAGGIMDEALRIEFLNAQWALKSAYYPPIPDWLAGLYVQMAVFVPNGDIVILGWDAGNDAGLSKAELAESTDPGWYRYNSDGELVDQCLTGERDWARLYHDDRTWLVSDAETRGLETSSSYGYLMIREPDSGPIEAIYDYDGRVIDPGQPLYREPNMCVLLRWSELVQVLDYRARVASEQP